MTIYRRAAVLVALVWFPARAVAQPLERFLEAAGAQNVDARISAATAARTRAEAGQTWGGLLPALSVSAGWTRNQYAAEVSIPTGPATSQTITIVPLSQLDGSLKAEVPLIDVNRWLRTSAALEGAAAADDREAGTRDQVKRQVVLAYYSAAGARSLVGAAERSLEVARAQLNQQTARSQAGVGSELDQVRAAAEIQRNEQVLADAEALDANARRTLYALTRLRVEAIPELPADDLHPEPAAEQLLPRIEALPGLRAAGRDAAAARRSWTAAATTLVPTVTAQFTQRFTNATGFQGQSALWNAGLNLNWRLDAVGVQGIRAAAATEELADLAVEKARLAAEDQLLSDWQRARAAITKAKATRSQVTAVRRAAALALERNAAGVATQLEVIQANRDLLQGEVNEIQARFELASARACLHLSAGLPVEGTP